MIGTIGFLLGLLLFIIGVFPFLSATQTASQLPVFLTNILIKPPSVAMNIGFILAGIFLWLDASRRTRVFNGVVSIIVGLVSISLGAYPLLISMGVITDFATGLTVLAYNYYQYVLMLLGLLLIYDSFGGTYRRE
ncbi:hypothetical protein HYT58_02275 [Candidatus Woesearchaeota archaeon]|nr:hypothetical protein [Candidatus Woesearchaeota archaeon]